MNTKTTTLLCFAIIGVAVITGAFAYPYLPAEVASHWNARGVADDYMPKFWGIFLMPIVMFVLLAVYRIVPAIDPLRKNIESFRSYYNLFWLVLFLFFFAIFLLIVIWNLGYMFSFTLFIIPPIAALFYAIGAVLEHTKRNWFMGIRTPWTLSDDTVWEKTHKLAGRLFKIGGLFALTGLIIRDSAFALGAIIVPAMAIALISVVYSYIVYRQKH
ncbi:MAG: hypothetical protein COU47_03725 [Candidatus Niyogibacteria bacterium CG10_big_fil_rev_8_21_14_0_10_46_36]|uniref:DUF1648 domain-containing protein n=1 Tax=Candidatus Niyogibacteria bacterium CG10_big_fil_rev_8_21_14_0_10_46_36 TaxID=1974726 RepID=A0A2H0TCC6_9BACT|nr:MAG: hypothetical protein COU47_03725 [Candidatus Niyogibacteria bacterium CG10_big_fil_rev_8_21_14_0_10_46_36]